MASLPLSAEPNYFDFFSEGALVNLRYWQQHPAVQHMDIAALDHYLEHLLRAIKFASKVEAAWPILLDLCRTLASFMERRGYWDSWQHVLTQALTMANRVEDQAGAVEISLLLARLYQRQSRFKATIRQYRYTMRLARQIGDEVTRARACSNLGYLYIDQGHWLRSEVLCQSALAVFERLDHQHGRAHTHNHLGFLYLRQRRWKLAQQHLEPACEIWERIGDKHGLMRGFINLGLLFNEMESPHEALTHLKKALHYTHYVGEQIDVARIHNNMAIAYRLSGEPSKAEMAAWQAKKIFQKYQDILGLAEAKDNLGLACLDQGKWQEAKQYLTEALSGWNDLANQIGIDRTLAYLAEYELARKNQTSQMVSTIG